MENNKEALKNPIIKSFLDNMLNYELVKQAVTNPTDENKKIINVLFKKHYMNVKKITYINNLIYYFSIDYDKKIKKIYNLYTLTLDKKISDGNNTTFKDLIETKPYYGYQNIYGYRLKNHIENKMLYKALNKLTEKQLFILEMKYFNKLTLYEIAEATNTSTQNISNQHNKALKHLKNFIGTKK
ncbi:sigma-70 family RNA polymerase sigma factor [Virgibacillus kimchii]